MREARINVASAQPSLPDDVKGDVFVDVARVSAHILARPA